MELWASRLIPAPKLFPCLQGAKQGWGTKGPEHCCVPPLSSWGWVAYNKTPHHS